MPYAARQQCIGRPLRTGRIGYGHSREHGALPAVGRKQVAAPQQLVGDRRRRGGIEDHPHAVPLGHLGRTHHRRQRNFELQHDEIRRRDLGLRPVDVLRRQTLVGARGHDDRILGRPIDADQRHARRHGCVARHMAHVQPLGAVARERTLAEQIVPHARHEGHFAAQPRSRDGLIGPLAAA